jgi:hypothetical protein
MIKFFFLLPILMSAIWWFYLDSKGCTLKQGLKGFAYIIAFNLVIISFFILMLYVTH